MHDVIDLPIERVNALSPYKVYINNNGSLGFETQYGSVYEVGFVEDYTFMDENAFQFFIRGEKRCVSKFGRSENI